MCNHLERAQDREAATQKERAEERRSLGAHLDRTLDREEALAKMLEQLRTRLDDQANTSDAREKILGDDRSAPPSVKSPSTTTPALSQLHTRAAPSTPTKLDWLEEEQRRLQIRLADMERTERAAADARA
jgi:hypothetical protein